MKNIILADLRSSTASVYDSSTRTMRHAKPEYITRCFARIQAQGARVELLDIYSTSTIHRIWIDGEACADLHVAPGGRATVI